jgi:hypothetical protein
MRRFLTKDLWQCALVSTKAEIVLAVLVGVWAARPDASPSVAKPTPAPVILLATAVPAMSILVVAPPAELRFLRAVVAYDAPNGKVLGAIEGSGTVWVRRQDLEDVVDVATPIPTGSRSSLPLSSGGRRHEHSQRPPRRRHQLEHHQLPRRPSHGQSCIGARPNRDTPRSSTQPVSGTARSPRRD